MPVQGTQLGLGRCPHCGVDHPSLPRHQGFETEGVSTKEKRYWSTYVCTRCGGVITASSPHDGAEITRIYPGPDEVSDSVPNPARQYLTQAIDSVHAPAASVMVAASAVDAMLKAIRLAACTQE